MALIDSTRHREIFNPELFNDGVKRCTVIGAGAVGGRVVMELAKLGVARINVYDGDTVAEHNVANQPYGRSDIGKPKVEALAERVFEDTAQLIVGWARQWEAPKEPEKETQTLGYLFVCVDSMAVRAEIAQVARSIRNRPGIPLVIDTRMSADQGRIYTLPNTDLQRWEHYMAHQLYSDEEADAAPDPTGCATTQSIGATAALTASLALWQFMLHVQGKNTDYELLFGVNPAALVASAPVGA